MTKVEEKLIELGYEAKGEIYIMWLKGNIQIITFYGRMDSCCVIIPNSIYRQQDIDNIQQEFNQLQEDLEILEELENEASI